MTGAHSQQLLEPTCRDDAVHHGLNLEEYDRVCRGLNRPPNLVELGIYGVMWSEHCSYKSSRVWLKTLPTDAPWVICGPGENAGVVDIGDGQAAIFKMESHNHPSFIEPYQGAATGVGGIMRDIFTMGARPVANMNALRFGAVDHPRTRHLLAGVVRGIGGYGNCVGVPTVGGETNFHPAYDGNILVNAMTVGLADTDKIFYSAAAGVGNPVVYVGSETGRDGIHGATMASAEFDADTEEKRPTVQVGDPFTEKLLIEACLELMATDAIIAIQDMGAAGLTCSTVEMADKGGVGIHLNLDRVPCREAHMSAYDIMLSESQERMLMVLRPGAETQARRIFEKWQLQFAVVGEVTASNHLTVEKDGELVVDVPVRVLVDDAPVYERPWQPTPPPAALQKDDCRRRAALADNTALDDLLLLMGSADLCSRHWLWEQYDSMVMADTVVGPGGDAAVVRVHGLDKALAVSTDCTPRYCQADPKRGGAQAVTECWRNLTATGATPLAITDCLNFGNPERPDIMGQFVGAVQGIGEAARSLNFPIVSGNVSLYNETNGQAILPTPAIGGVGVISDYNRTARIGFRRSGDHILLLGKPGSHLGQSLWLREIAGHETGPAPQIDFSAERLHGEFVRRLIAEGTLDTCHDISDGGLLVALAEMALAGKMGATVTLPDTINGADARIAWLFGEDQGRYLLAVPSAVLEGVFLEAAEQSVPILEIGHTGGAHLSLAPDAQLSIETLFTAHRDFLPNLMA